MEITYLGHASFALKGKNATVVCDPFDPQMVGLPAKPVSADIVTVSHDHPDHNFLKEVKTKNPEVFVVAGPGEYEIKGVSILGLPTFHDEKQGTLRGKNTVYRIAIDDVVVAHLGDLGHKLSDSQLEDLDGVDILLIPVGGFYTIDAKAAAEVVAQISPQIVIPMHYKTPKHNEENFAQVAVVSQFLKEMGREDLTPQAKLSINKDKLPEELQVVVLE